MTPTATYVDLREHLLALGWGPIHLSFRAGRWLARAAGNRSGVGTTIGEAVASLLVTNAAGDA